jgi:hypothetical protein
VKTDIVFETITAAAAFVSHVKMVNLAPHVVRGLHLGRDFLDEVRLIGILVTHDRAAGRGDHYD